MGGGLVWMQGGEHLPLGATSISLLSPWAVHTVWSPVLPVQQALMHTLMANWKGVPAQLSEPWLHKRGADGIGGQL